MVMKNEMIIILISLWKANQFNNKNQNNSPKPKQSKKKTENQFPNKHYTNG